MSTRIALIDPGLYDEERASPNIGDLVISRASHREIRGLFGGDSEITRVPSHSVLRNSSYEKIEDADHIIVGGSNLLWFRFFPLASWRLRLRDLFRLKNVITLGVGWGSYSRRAGAYSRFAAKQVFSDERLLSARDSYTVKVMKNNLGLANVINTGCHTTWCLSQDEADYPKTMASECVFSLTDYAKSPKEDKFLIDTLNRLYGKKLLFWPQGAGDLAYVRKLGYTGDCLSENLENLIEVFSKPEKPDYVGTRLHAGILAMEFAVRSVIIAIDNRAIEMGNDIDLNWILRRDLRNLESLLVGEISTRLTLNSQGIRSWQEQFNAE